MITKYLDEEIKDLEEMYHDEGLLNFELEKLTEFRMIKKQLIIADVSQQRELLIDFVTWQTYSSNLGITIEDRVDIYLKQKGN